MKKDNYLTIALALVLATLLGKFIIPASFSEAAWKEANKGDFRPAFICLVFAGTMGWFSAKLASWIMEHPKTKRFFGLNN